MTSPRRDPRAVPRLLALAGPSGAGKTTLAEHLVRRWSGAGIAVGYVKHASHGFQMDRRGKDTARLGEACAVGVAVTGPEGTAYLERGGPRRADELARRFFPEARVVVVEGFREERHPTVLLADATAPVEVPRDGVGHVLAGYGPASRRRALAAVVGDRPVFARDELDALLAFLDRWLACVPSARPRRTRAPSPPRALPIGAAVP